MSTTNPIVRIFISSPNDVKEERDAARLVIDNLQQRYADVKLETVFWEDLPLPATASFQESIDFLLKKKPIDIAIFVLWARLGTPLGPQVSRADGSRYRSGTEREFDLMLAAYEQSGEKKRPIIFAYTREDNEEFIERLKTFPQSEWDEMILQSKLANDFIREHFRDAHGLNMRAYHTYPKPITFAQRLRLHLKAQLDEILSVEMGQHWEDEPYRGLQCFDVQHGPIFKGRDRETCDLLERLESRSQAGCASVVIVGASGSGKSSLARAGVAATLRHDVPEEGIKEWRVVAFTPGRGSEDLLGRLTRAIVAELPESKTSSQTIQDIAAALAGDRPEKVVRIGIVPIFERAAEQFGGTIRLLLIVDQLEELWTDQRFSPAIRKQFLDVVHALACSSRISVVMTLRSDFYPEAQQSEGFLALKDGRGHFDLLPPGTEVLNRLITEPARLAGLRFESDPKTGRMLDQEIVKGAQNHVALPLLQYALSELYQKRDQGRNLLTLAAYDELGGLEGAIGRRAEKIYADLSAEVRASLPDVVRRLVVLREGSEEAFTAARGEMSQVATTPQRRALIDAFVDARLLVVDHTESGATVGFAHEALLAHWPRLTRLLEEDREFIRVRQRIKAAARRWNEENRSHDYLLPSGKPLAEGRDLLQRRRSDLDNESIEFVTRSIAWAESTRNIRRAVVAAATLAFLLVSGILSFVFYVQKLNADALRTKAQESEQLAQRNLALVRINLASHSWRMGDLRRARQHLHDTPVERRGWEWHYVKRLSEGNRLTIPTSKPGTSVKWSRDGKSLLSTWTAPKAPEITTGGKIDSELPLLKLQTGISSKAEEGGIEVWEATTGKRLFEFQHPDGPTSIATFIETKSETRPAGSLVLSVSEPKGPLGLPSSLVKGVGDPARYEVQVWRERTPEALRKLERSAHFVSIGRDGYVAMVTNDHSKAKTDLLSKQLTEGGNPFVSTGAQFRVWNLAEDVSEVVSFTFPGSAVTSLLFHPDNKQLVSSHQDGSVRFWDIEQGKEVATILTGLNGFGLGAISDDGHFLALIGQLSAESIEIWDATSKERFSKIQVDAPSSKMAFDREGSQLAIGSWDNTIHLCDVRSGKEMRVYRGHSDRVVDIAFHPQEPVLASCSMDETIKLWDLNVSDQRATVLKAPGSTIRKLALPDTGPSVAIVRDDQSVEVWNTFTGIREHQVENGSFVAISPKGDVLATGNLNDLILTHFDTGASTVRCKGHDQKVMSAAFSMDGQRVVSVDQGGKWIIWRASDGEKLMEQPELTGLASWVLGAGFSPNGEKLLGHDNINDSLMVWDVGKTATNSKYDAYDLPHTLVGVGMSDDGKRLVALSGSGFDRPALLSVWESGKREPLFTHQVAGGFVYGAAVSPNGKRLFTAISGKGVQVWDIDSGLEALSLTDPGEDAHALVLSASGHRLAGVDQKSETVWIWDATPMAGAE
jgi:WD40 repeat protein